MQVTTIYNIDNYVWFIGNGCLAKSKITSIEIHIVSKDATHPDIKYHIEELPNPMREHMIFETKEALIQSL
jgi:hypothetical protein